jgi:hypothetical protein
LREEERREDRSEFDFARFGRAFERAGCGSGVPSLLCLLAESDGTPSYRHRSTAACGGEAGGGSGGENGEPESGFRAEKGERKARDEYNDGAGSRARMRTRSRDGEPLDTASERRKMTRKRRFLVPTDNVSVYSSSLPITIAGISSSSLSSSSSPPFAAGAFLTTSTVFVVVDLTIST